MMHESAMAGELLVTHWFLIRTAPAKEPLAAHILKARNFKVYSPMIRRWRRVTRHARRREPESRYYALFPGYVFVGLDAETPDGEALRDTPCVVSFVSLDGVNPYEVPAAVVEELRARFGELVTGPRFHRWLKGRPFGPGDEVVLVGSSVSPLLRGVVFKVERIQGRAAEIFSSLFGGVRVSAALDNLEARE